MGINFQAGFFEQNAVGSELKALAKAGSLPDPLEYVYHEKNGEILPKQIDISLSFIMTHDKPLGFGGSRRLPGSLGWAPNDGRDWPHGTGPFRAAKYCQRESNQETAVRYTTSPEIQAWETDALLYADELSDQLDEGVFERQSRLVTTEGDVRVLHDGPGTSDFFLTETVVEADNSEVAELQSQAQRAAKERYGSTRAEKARQGIIVPEGTEESLFEND